MSAVVFVAGCSPELDNGVDKEIDSIERTPPPIHYSSGELVSAESSSINGDVQYRFEGDRGTSNCISGDCEYIIDGCALASNSHSVAIVEVVERPIQMECPHDFSGDYIKFKSHVVDVIAGYPLPNEVDIYTSYWRGSRHLVGDEDKIGDYVLVSLRGTKSEWIAFQSIDVLLESDEEYSPQSSTLIDLPSSISELSQVLNSVILGDTECANSSWASDEDVYSSVHSGAQCEKENGVDDTEPPEDSFPHDPYTDDYVGD